MIDDMERPTYFGVICDGAGCSREATRRFFAVWIGPTLFLCDDCSVDDVNLRTLGIRWQEDDLAGELEDERIGSKLGRFEGGQALRRKVGV